MTKTTKKPAAKTTKTTTRARRAPVKSVAKTKAPKKAAVAKKTTQRKGIKHHAKRIYKLTPKFIHGMIAGAFLGAVLLVPLGKIGHSSALSISSGKDCDAWSIINCGVTSTTDLINKYNSSAYIQAVYQSRGITAAKVRAMGTTAVAGIVYNDGTVRVGGKLVAKDVMTEARQRVTSSDRQVTYNGATFYTRALASSWSHTSAPAYVVMQNNVFQFAILAPCGNSITGTPTTSPPPPPAPKPVMITVCDLATQKMVSIPSTSYNSTKYSKNSEDCVPNIQVCNLTTLKVVTIKANAFDSKTESKTLSDCTPPVSMIVVCDLATKTMIPIKATDFNSATESKDPEACIPTISVCDLSTKTIITIKESAFDPTEQSLVAADCQTTPAPTPTPVVAQPAATALPNTGPGAVIVIALCAVMGGFVFHHYHNRRQVHHRRHHAAHRR